MAIGLDRLLEELRQATKKAKGPPVPVIQPPAGVGPRPPDPPSAFWPTPARAPWGGPYADWLRQVLTAMRSRIAESPITRDLPWLPVGPTWWTSTIDPVPQTIAQPTTITSTPLSLATTTALRLWSSSLLASLRAASPPTALAPPVSPQDAYAQLVTIAAYQALAALGDPIPNTKTAIDALNIIVTTEPPPPDG